MGKMVLYAFTFSLFLLIFHKSKTFFSERPSTKDDRGRISGKFLFCVQEDEVLGRSKSLKKNPYFWSKKGIIIEGLKMYAP